MWRRRDLLLALSAFPAAGDVWANGNAPEDEALALIVAVNEAQARQDVDAAVLRAIFTMRKQYWRDDQRIVALNHPSGSPARVLFDRAVLGLGPDEARKFWIDRRVRAGVSPPRAVSSSALIARLVALIPTAIAYLPEGQAVKNARIVARIHKGRLVT